MTSPARAPRPTPRRDPARHDTGGRTASERPRHLRVVTASRPPRRSSSVRTAPVLAVAMAVVFTSLMASAVFHGLLVSGQSHLDRVNDELTAQQAALAQDKLELANLQSPARIAAEAAKLGMVPATQQHWLSPSGDAPVVTGDQGSPATSTGSGSGGATTSDLAAGTSDGATR